MRTHRPGAEAALRTTILLSTIAFAVAVGPIQAQTEVPLDVPAVRAAVLAKHNSLRSAHGSPPMTISASLNSTAQAWAKQNATSGQLAHSAPNQRNGAGENIYVSYSGESFTPESLAD